MLGWMNHKFKPILPGEISTLSGMQIIPLMAESEQELKSLLMSLREESEKAGLKFNIKKTKIMASDPITVWKMQEKKVEAVIDRFYSLELQNHCGWWLQLLN